MNKQIRNCIFVCLIVVLGIMVWWMYVYSPLMDQKTELEQNVELNTEKLTHIKERIKDLTEFAPETLKKKKQLDEFSNLLVDGNSIEEINARSKQIIGDYIEKYKLDLNSYKDSSTVKWRKYQVCRVQFQMEVTTEQFTDFLAFIDTLKKVIRVDRLTTNYQRRRDKEIRLSLIIGTLFIKSGEE